VQNKTVEISYAFQEAARVEPLFLSTLMNENQRNLMHLD